MRGKNANPRRRLRLVAAFILVTGLAGAGLIYSMAENAADSALIQEMENSKKYRHELEAYGGKANVLAAEFFRWFAGIWQGKSLGITVGCLAVLLSLALFFIAYHMPDDPHADGGDENDREGPG